MKNIHLKKPLLWMLLGAVLAAIAPVFVQYQTAQLSSWLSTLVSILQWGSLLPLVLGTCALLFGEHCNAKKAYGYGFLTIYLYYFVIYHWLVNLYPLDFVGLDSGTSLVVIAAGWFGLPLLQALPGGLMFLALYGLRKREVFMEGGVLFAASFGALWCIFEWSSTLWWTGVPWGRLCLGQVGLLPMLQSASLLGSYFVTFLLVFVNCLLAQALFGGGRRLLYGALAVLVAASNLGFGMLRMQEHTEQDTLRVAVIQGNINSHEKWSGDMSITMEAYERLTLQAIADGAELIVWPETVFPYTLNHPRNSYLRQFVSELAKEHGVTLLVGALYEDSEGHSYNALYLVASDGTISNDVYAKRHLVPFGEYVPMRNVIMTLIPPLAELSALGEDTYAGDAPAVFETEYGSIGSLICFDSIYEQLTVDSVRDGANLMVVSSNDSWFYDSAAVYMHCAQSQLRAIESGRFFARAANTGISAIITQNGEVLRQLPPLVEGYAVEDVPMLNEETLYTKVGNLWVGLCFAFLFLLVEYSVVCGEDLKRYRALRTRG